MGNRGIFYRQLVTPSVVVSAVSTVTMICITVFQNSLFFIRLSIVLMKKNFKNPFIDIYLCQDYRCCLPMPDWKQVFIIHHHQQQHAGMLDVNKRKTSLTLKNSCAKMSISAKNCFYCFSFVLDEKSHRDWWYACGLWRWACSLGKACRHTIRDVVSPSTKGFLRFL